MSQQIVNNSDSGLTARSKINANFTELYASAGSVTASNGLIKVADDIQLGGILTGPTDIETGTHRLRIRVDTDNVFQLEGVVSGGGVQFNTDGTGNETLLLSAFNDVGANALALSLNPAIGAVFTDGRVTKKGIQYAAAGYVTDVRSLTDKEYVDARIAQTITDGVTTSAPSQDAVFDALALKSPILTFSQGLTRTVNNTILGGTITTGNNNVVNFSGDSSLIIGDDGVAGFLVSRESGVQVAVLFGQDGNYGISYSSSLTYGTVLGELRYDASPGAVNAKTITDVSYVLGTKTFTGIQSFTNTASNAGLILGSTAGNPSAPSNAGLWYNSSTNYYGFRINGTTHIGITSLAGTTANRVQLGGATGTAIIDSAGLTYNGTTFQTDATTVTFGSATTFNISGASGQLIMSGTSSQIRVQQVRGASTSSPLVLYGSESIATSKIRIANNNDAAIQAASGTNDLFLIGTTFSPTSGTGVFSTVNINTVVNQTGGANGAVAQLLISGTYTAGVTVRGIYYNPTIGTVTTHIAIETTSGNWILTAGKLSVKGVNNTSAFLVEDDAGNDIADFGESGGVRVVGFFGATPAVQGTTGGAASTFVANTSLIANDTATFDGYTIGQVVKAIRNFGLLA